jgi:2'-5' RNA ligase
LRLFIAINLPDQQVRDLKRALYRLASYDLPVRWLAEESLHITLQFLGEVSDARVPPVQAALEQSVTGLSQFEVEIGGLGAFPALRRPNIFWIGVAESPELLELHRRVDAAMAGLGFPSEDRPFKPHITLGRVHKDGRAIDRKVVDRMVAEFDYKSEFRAAGVDLMRSRLSPRGARHDLIERMELP